MKHIAESTNLTINLKLKKSPNLKKIELLIPEKLNHLNKEIKIDKNEVYITLEIPKTALFITKGNQANIQRYILLAETIHTEDISDLIHAIYSRYGISEDSELEGSFKISKILGATFLQKEATTSAAKYSFASDSVSSTFTIKKPDIEKIQKEWDSFQSRLNRFAGLE